VPLVDASWGGMLCCIDSRFLLLHAVLTCLLALLQSLSIVEQAAKRASKRGRK